jgi:hypothetical protein
MKGKVKIARFSLLKKRYYNMNIFSLCRHNEMFIFLPWMPLAGVNKMEAE